MNKDKILKLCEEIENTLSDAWNSGAIEYDLAGHIVSFAKKIAAEITAPPKSNGDKIRAMLTDEVIAKQFFCVFYDICADCPLGHVENCISIEERMKWLKQEVIEDANN